MGSSSRPGAIRVRGPASSTSRRDVELAGPRTLMAPGLDELPIRREFHDTRIGFSAMPVGDENVAARRDIDGGRGIELVGSAARDAGATERHQDRAVGAELEDLMTFAVAPEAVGDPHVAGVVHM